MDMMLKLKRLKTQNAIALLLWKKHKYLSFKYEYKQTDKKEPECYILKYACINRGTTYSKMHKTHKSL